jgi:hypothetical protein
MCHVARPEFGANRVQRLHCRKCCHGSECLLVFREYPRRVDDVGVRDAANGRYEPKLIKREPN